MRQTIFFLLTLPFYSSLYAQKDPTLNSSQPIEANEVYIPSFAEQLTHVIITLAIIIACFAIVLWLIKKYMHSQMQQANTSSTIKILESRSLSPRSMLYLIDVHGKKIVVSETPHGVRTLTELPPAFPLDKQQKQSHK